MCQQLLEKDGYTVKTKLVDSRDAYMPTGITLLDVSPATDTNAFFVTQEFSDAAGVTTLSDLEGTTDGTLESQGLVVLEDDQQIQPAQNLVLAVGTDFLAEHADVADTLNALMAALTTEKLTELNGRIAVDRETPEDVATDLLTEAGLL